MPKRLVLVTLLLVMSCSLVARASCAHDQSPPCQSFWQADVVFTGTVVRTSYSDTYERSDGGGKWNYQDRIAHFSVDEVFRGKLEGQVSVVATVALVTAYVLPNGTSGSKWRSDADCAYKFKDGERYLVYATFRKTGDGTLSVGYNRTRPVAESVADLRYIRSLGQSRPLGRVYGVVKQVDRDLRKYDTAPPARFVANMEILLQGNNQEYRTFTDAQGRFELVDLPPGEYELIPKYPRELSADLPQKVRIVERGCVEANLYTQSDARISGRVYDDQGKPIPKIRLDLARADQDERDPNPDVLWAFADEEGRYEFKSVAKGRYVLGVRLNAIRDADFPYPRSYYPGVSKPTEAKVFELEEGQRIESIDFVMPARLASRTIEGEVVWPDGRPVAGASVLLTITEYPFNFASGGIGRTDQMGRFSVRAFAGLSYKVNAFVNLDDGRQMHAEPLDLDRANDIRNIKLVVTSNGGSCERCRFRYQPKKKS